MFGFFKSKKPEASVQKVPEQVPYHDVQSLVKDHCKKIIAIGIQQDPKAKNPMAFGYDPSGKSSLGYALLGVPCVSPMFGPSGDTPYYIGKDICIEAIVLCMNKEYSCSKVSEEHLLKIGYHYASYFIK